jgi:hypothetical protein
MKLRNCDCPLLNSPVLSLGATQFVILSAACDKYVSYYPAVDRGEARTIFAELFEEKSRVLDFRYTPSCADRCCTRESMNKSEGFVGFMVLLKVKKGFYCT